MCDTFSDSPHFIRDSTFIINNLHIMFVFLSHVRGAMWLMFMTVFPMSKAMLE